MLFGGGEAPYQTKKFMNVSIFELKKKFKFFFLKSFKFTMRNRLNRRKKIDFQIFIFRVMVIFVLKSSQFSMNFHDNSKIDFSFVSAHGASSIKTGSKLRGGGGQGKTHKNFERTISQKLKIDFSFVSEHCAIF